MKLIDADALDAEMYHKSFEVDDGRNVWNSGLWIRYKIFEEAIRDAPTVDAEPVRHGKWIDETFKPWGLVHHPFKCNLCGDHAEFASPYCPNCGARMDEERKEE